jgi:hypothetical protein
MEWTVPPCIGNGEPRLRSDRQRTSTGRFGRRLKGEPPESLGLIVRKLVAALEPLGGEHPLPHYRRGT